MRQPRCSGTHSMRPQWASGRLPAGRNARLASHHDRLVEAICRAVDEPIEDRRTDARLDRMLRRLVRGGLHRLGGFRRPRRRVA